MVENSVQRTLQSSCGKKRSATNAVVLVQRKTARKWTPTFPYGITRRNTSARITVQHRTASPRVRVSWHVLRDLLPGECQRFCV